MKYQKHAGPRGSVAKMVATVCGVMVLISGVTFAALTSQNATLQGNSITSATANLLIGDPQGQYGATMNGFNFSNVVPGGNAAPMTGNYFGLKNTGSTTLTLRLAINPANLTNPGHVDLSKVYIDITPPGGEPMRQFTIADLTEAYTSGQPVEIGTAPLPPANSGSYRVQAQMQADAVTSTQSGISIGGIDLLFSGLADAK